MRLTFRSIIILGPIVILDCLSSTSSSSLKRKDDAPRHIPERYSASNLLYTQLMSACYSGESQALEGHVEQAKRNFDPLLLHQYMSQCLELILLLKDSREMLKILTGSYSAIIIPSNVEELSDNYLDILYLRHLQKFTDFEEMKRFAVEIKAFTRISIFHYLFRRGFLDAYNGYHLHSLEWISYVNQIPLEIHLWAAKKMHILPNIQNLRSIAHQVRSVEILLDLARHVPAVLKDEEFLVKTVEGGSLEVYNYIVRLDRTMLSKDSKILQAILSSSNPNAATILDQFVLDTRLSLESVAPRFVEFADCIGATMSVEMFNKLWQHLSPKHQKKLFWSFPYFQENTDVLPAMIKRMQESKHFIDPQIIQAYLRPSSCEGYSLVSLEKRIALLDDSLPGWQELVFNGCFFDPIFFSFQHPRHLFRLLKAITLKGNKINGSKAMQIVDDRTVVEALPSPIFDLFNSIYIY